MSWEAFRLTSKSPGELYSVLGPHGVDEKVGDVFRTCWREYQGEDRSLETVRKVVQRIFDSNLAVWNAIKKPTPEAFFQNLGHHPADGHMRQALVLCYMMLPRGNKSIAIVRKIVTSIYERHLSAWLTDHRTFTTGPGKVKSTPRTKLKPTALRKPVRSSKPTKRSNKGR